MREKEQCVDEAVTALAKGKTLLPAAPRGAAPTQDAGYMSFIQGW